MSLKDPHGLHTAVIAVGTGCLSAAAGLYLLSERLFRLTIVGRRRCSILRRRSVKTTLQNPSMLDNNDEEQRARQWFAQTRSPVNMLSQDNLRLHAWQMEPDRANPRPHLYAICCHAMSEGPSDMAKVAHRFARIGFHVLLPARRGHELSKGRYIGMGWLERRDLLGWIKYIVRKDPQARILLDGNCLGACTVMMVMGEPDLPKNVIAAIEDSGANTAWDVFVRAARTMYHIPDWLAVPLTEFVSLLAELRAGYSLREASSIRQLNKSTLPILFIHGCADDVVKPVSLRRNFQASASLDKELMTIPGAGHTMASTLDPATYWNRVEGFVSRQFHL